MPIVSTSQLAPEPLFQAFGTNGQFLAGGLLYTYAAGTSTPVATYPSANTVTPNTNPIVLNALGQAPLWLTPGQAYKFLLTDQYGNTLPGYPVDNITSPSSSGAGNLLPSASNTYSLGSSTLSWSQLYLGPSGAPIFDIISGNVGYFAETAAETAALAVVAGSVVDFTYPPGYVDRYVANLTPGSGTIDCALGFNAAYQVALAIGCAVRYGATAPYQTLTTIRYTTSGGPNQNGVTTLCDGGGGASDKANLLIIAAFSNTPIFDCTGTQGLIFERVTIQTASGSTPNTAFLQARNSGGGGAGLARFINCSVIGSFTVCPVYNYGSENNLYEGCYFLNQATTPSTEVLTITANNIAGLVSQSVTIASGSQSTTQNVIEACELYNAAGTPTSYCVYLESAVFVSIKDSWMACFGATTGGGALIGINQANGPSNNLTIDNIMGEQNGAVIPTCGILAFNAPQTHVAWSVTNCLFPNTSLAISINGTLSSSYISNITEQPGTSHGLAANALTDCTINAQALPLAITTSTNNELIGFTDRWTISNRSHDSWTEMGTANRTFTPVYNAGFTFTGAQTSRPKCTYEGNMVYFSLLFAAATTVAWTAGASITGLLGVATDEFCATVYDATAGTVLGNCNIQGSVSTSTLTIPVAQGATGHSIIISGFYFVS
jgi:hypothetical protein